MDITGWIMMFVMLTLCSWTYHSKLPLPIFKYSMYATGVIAIAMTAVQFVYNHVL